VASVDNERLVRAGYDAFNEGNIDFLVEHLDPNIEWVEPREVPGMRILGEPDGVRRYLEGFGELWEEFRIEPEELFVLDEERVLVLARLTARGKESGAPVEAGVAHLWTLRDGRAVGMKVFLDRVDALKEAGIR
jgi:ketosteroid isomerase-like protein